MSDNDADFTVMMSDSGKWEQRGAVKYSVYSFPAICERGKVAPRKFVKPLFFLRLALGNTHLVEMRFFWFIFVTCPKSLDFD